MADLLPRLMTQEEARDCLDDIRVGTLKVKERLIELHERRGWEALGYPSWRECIEAELQISKSTAYRLLDAAYIQRGLSQNGKNLPDSHAMELKKVEPEKRAAALAKAKESAAAHGRAHPTAKDIRDAVESGSGSEPPHDATRQDAERARKPVTDGDQLQQGDDDGYGTTRGARTSDARHTGRRLLDESQEAQPCSSNSDHTAVVSGTCPRGGSHQPKREAGETFCHKCFEPLDESEAEDPYDTTSLDDFCQWTIDQCEPQHREQLAARLAHWAKEAKGTK